MSDEIEVGGPAWRQPRVRGLDPDLRRMLLVAAAAGGALVLVLGGWSMLGHRNRGVPVIEAPSGPVRVRPENPGGMTVGVLPGPVDGDGGEGTLAPPPEAPDPQRLRAQVQAGQAPPGPATPPPVTLVVPDAPSPAARSPAASDDAAAPAAPAPSAVAPARPSAEAPPRPVTREAHPAARPASSPDADVARTPPAAAPPAARVAPPGRPGATPSALGEAAQMPAAPPARAAALPPQAPTAATGGVQVQLAAMDAAAGADAEWERLRRRMPELLDGRRPAVIRAERDGRTLYRLRLGGFADTAAAIGFCARVRAKGGACSIADF